MFKAAFGDENITGERILKAISQFMATMISADSKYDRMKKETPFSRLKKIRGWLVSE
jgi:cytochrome c peroxidase